MTGYAFLTCSVLAVLVLLGVLWIGLWDAGTDPDVPALDIEHVRESARTALVVMFEAEDRLRRA